MLNNYLSTVGTIEINKHLPKSEIRFTRTKGKKLESILITELMIIKRSETCTVITLEDQSVYIQVQDH